MQQRRRNAIAVPIQASTPAERTDPFARAHGLSAREVELLTHLVAGGDTRDLARQMHLSEHPIQDHLKSIFSKTAVHYRRTLLTRALGTRTDSVSTRPVPFARRAAEPRHYWSPIWRRDRQRCRA